MKSSLWLVLGIAGLAATVSALMAVDGTTSYPLYAPPTPAPLDYSGTNSVTASSSSAVIVGMSAQVLLLKDLAQNHQTKAADLTLKNQADKAKWETELVNELQEKSALVQKIIDRMSQSGAITNYLRSAGDLDDQLVFVSTVEARLAQLRQELTAANADSRILSLQLATNKTPEDAVTISATLTENQKLMKDLQKEQLDLEMRRLEFRAIQKTLLK